MEEVANMVLIVPYGIEIRQRHLHDKHQSVLIVPYGIEIWKFCINVIGPLNVLIVPYGIEIWKFCINVIGPLNVLIVPYGIEITVPNTRHRYPSGINCTLWN